MSVTVIAIGVASLAATALTVAATIPLVRAEAPTSAASSSFAGAVSPSTSPTSGPSSPATPRARSFVLPNTTSPLPPAAVPHALANAIPSAARWVWPVEGTPRVIRGFQPPPKNWLPGHRGVDLAAVPGDHVRAAGAGIVTFAGSLAGRGVVVVSHGELRTTYEPVTASVEVGDSVTVGERIGVIAVGASHCGGDPACLHWGLRRGDVYLDPLALLGMVHPVLLPLP